MRRTPVFIIGWRASVVLIVGPVGLVVDFRHYVDGLLDAGNSYLVSLDQVEPRDADLNRFINIQVESIDVFTLPFSQDSDLFDRISPHSDHSLFEHLADSVFDSLCHVRFVIFGFRVPFSVKCEAQSRTSYKEQVPGWILHHRLPNLHQTKMFRRSSLP